MGEKHCTLTSPYSLGVTRCNRYVRTVYGVKFMTPAGAATRGKKTVSKASFRRPLDLAYHGQQGSPRNAIPKERRRIQYWGDNEMLAFGEIHMLLHCRELQNWTQKMTDSAMW